MKTRLAAGIGPVAALGVYRRLAARVIGRVARDRRWRTVLAVAPDSAAGIARVWPAARGLRRRDQGRGDLGQRMARALRGARPAGPAVLIGSDIPGIDARRVAAAFRALNRSEVVFGPAEDGGYWLIGFRRRPIGPYRPLRGVRWSGPHALADSRASLAGRSISLLDALPDIDDVTDLRAWRARGGS